MKTLNKFWITIVGKKHVYIHGLLTKYIKHDRTLKKHIEVPIYNTEKKKFLDQLSEN